MPRAASGWVSFPAPDHDAPPCTGRSRPGPSRLLVARGTRCPGFHARKSATSRPRYAWHDAARPRPSAGHSSGALGGAGSCRAGGATLGTASTTSALPKGDPTALHCGCRRRMVGAARGARTSFHVEADRPPHMSRCVGTMVDVGPADSSVRHECCSSCATPANGPRRLPGTLFRRGLVPRRELFRPRRSSSRAEVSVPDARAAFSRLLAAACLTPARLHTPPTAGGGIRSRARGPGVHARPVRAGDQSRRPPSSPRSSAHAGGGLHHAPLLEGSARSPLDFFFSPMSRAFAGLRHRLHHRPRRHRHQPARLATHQSLRDIARRHRPARPRSGEDP